MSKFSHPNVMKLIGVCIDTGDSPYIVMPYMAYGSLLSYLKKHRAELTIANDDNSELVRIGMHASSTKAELSCSDWLIYLMCDFVLQVTTVQTKLLSMCLQVAKGMAYLATSG